MISRRSLLRGAGGLAVVSSLPLGAPATLAVPGVGCPAGPDQLAGALARHSRRAGSRLLRQVPITPATVNWARARVRPLRRPGWGADESFRYSPDGSLISPPAFFGVQTITVHHSGEPAPITDPVQHVRGIYYTHAVVNGWGDIGYQLLVDHRGRVYEGVYSDPDLLPVFGPTAGPDGRPHMVNGAHVGGFNAGNIGVCVLGNTTLAAPTDAAVRSLVALLSLLTRATGLDPAGTTAYVNPVSGSRATVPTICAHRDWHTANPAAGATECCGDRLYALLPSIRARVAAT